MTSVSDLTPIEGAVSRMARENACIAEAEEIPLGESLGRILASDLEAPVNVPHWDYSAMDGYAFAIADANLGGEVRLPVSQRIPAGTTGGPLRAGTVARIFTGSPIPEGADTVVKQENCTADGGTVVIHKMPRSGSNIRRMGEDIERGAVCLAAGSRLDAPAIGLAASLGLTRLPVLRRIRVALLCTGDELVVPGKPLGPGQIYGSNAFVLTGMIKRAGYEVFDFGYVPDRLDASVDALSRAARSADVVVVTGGVSVGEEDHVRKAMERAGQLDLWRLDVKPGKPLAYGRINGVVVVGLPGNPVSTYVTGLLVLMPFLRHLQGARPAPAARFEVRAAFDWPKPDSRRQFLLARLARGEDGCAEAGISQRQGSGVLSSAVWAEGLIDLPGGQMIERGDMVRYLPLTGLTG